VLNIKLSANYVSYDLTLHDKISIVRGDSATGKTTFVTLLEDLGTTTNIKLKSTLPTIAARNVSDITDHSNSIIVFDEDHPFWKHPDVMELINISENYFLFFLRDTKIPTSIHVSAVYKLETTMLDDIAHHTNIEMFERYSSDNWKPISNVIVEDSKSGLMYLSTYLGLNSVKFLDKASTKCITSSKSAARLPKELSNSLQRGADNILVVYDAAGFGQYLSRLLEVIALYPDRNVSILDWESFEWFVLYMMGAEYTRENVGTQWLSLERMCTDKLHALSSEYDKSGVPRCISLTDDCTTCARYPKCGFKTELPERKTKYMRHPIDVLNQVLSLPAEIIIKAKGQSIPIQEFLNKTELF